MFSELLSIIVLFIGLSLLWLILGRKLHRHLKTFSLFIFLFVVRDIVSLFVLHTPFGQGLVWSYTYWTSELIFSAIYLLMIAEISFRFLSVYPSIRRSATRLLVVVGFALLSWMAASLLRNFGHPRLFYMIGDQRLELTITVLILLVMAIGAYYRLKLSPLYRLVLIGIGIYSSVQVVANQIELQYKMGADSVFDYMRRGSFTTSLVVWTYAVWRWATAPAVRIELIPQSKYDHFSPQVHSRLQDVNLKLANLAGQRS